MHIHMDHEYESVYESGSNAFELRDHPSLSSFTLMIISIVRGGGGRKMMINIITMQCSQ